MAVQWEPIEAPQPLLSFAAYGRSPRLHLNADAQSALRVWFPGTAPLRVSIVRSKAEPKLIAVGLDDYGVQLDQGGYASAARFTKRLGVRLPLSITLRVDDSMKLLIGQLPLTEIPHMPLQLPPVDSPDLTSVKGIIRAVSTQALPDEEVVYSDTEHEDDDDSDDEDDSGAGD